MTRFHIQIDLTYLKCICCLHFTFFHKLIVGYFPRTGPYKSSGGTNSSKVALNNINYFCAIVFAPTSPVFSGDMMKIVDPFSL